MFNMPIIVTVSATGRNQKGEHHENGTDRDHRRSDYLPRMRARIPRPTTTRGHRGGDYQMREQRFARACIRAYAEGVIETHAVVLAEDFYDMVCDGRIEFKRVSAKNWQVLPYKMSNNRPVWVYPADEQSGVQNLLDSQEEEWWRNEMMED